MNDDSEEEKPRWKKEANRLNAEARARFAELEAVFNAPLPEGDDDVGGARSAERFRRCNLFLEFLETHREELLEVDFNGKNVGAMIAELRAGRAKAVRSRQELEKAEEELYQSAANVGDANVEAQVALFRLMSDWEALSAEELGAMPVEQRMKITDLVLDWRNGEREECLAQLPIAIRRELEA